MGAARDLAVIIVTWNVRDLARDALRALYADLKANLSVDLNTAPNTAPMKAIDAEVWVVDNASSDGTVEAIRAEFPAVKLIASSTNLGFAAGNNAALRALGFSDVPAPNPDGPRAVLLLNPDTLVQPGAIHALYRALFGLPRAGLVGARLSYGDGTFQHSAFRFPDLVQIVIDLYPLPDRVRGRLYESAINGRYSRVRYAGSAPFPVDHTLGAAMLLRREAIEATGLFDESYFMYVEEIDWSMRIRRAGWQIYIVPTAHIIHLEGRSTAQVRPQSIVNLWTSRFKFYAKHYSPFVCALARQIVRLGMRLKIGQTQRALRRGELDSAQAEALIAAYRKVIALER